MFLRRTVLAAALVVRRHVCLPAGPGTAARQPIALRRNAVAQHRAAPRQPDVAAAGHRRQPHTFYMAAVNGGVWKTTDAGRTWVPIFDDQPTGSIGSIAVAPSDPNILYVGSGEGPAPAGSIDR